MSPKVGLSMSQLCVVFSSGKSSDGGSQLRTSASIGYFSSQGASGRGAFPVGITEEEEGSSFPLGITEEEEEGSSFPLGITEEEGSSFPIGRTRGSS